MQMHSLTFGIDIAGMLPLRKLRFMLFSLFNIIFKEKFISRNQMNLWTIFNNEYKEGKKWMLLKYSVRMCLMMT